MYDTRLIRFIKLGLLTAPLLALTGCASPWERSFDPAVDTAAFEPTERVVIRRVPWGRLNTTLSELESARAANDIHPDEWTPEMRAEEKAELVRVLQLSEDPEDVLILGRSVFRSTSNVDILGGGLSAFARSIGADYAIWSTTSLGLTERVEHEPVTRHGWTSRRYRRGDGYVEYDYLPYHETMYVPVVVAREQSAWVVYYVRVVGE